MIDKIAAERDGVKVLTLLMQLGTGHDTIWTVRTIGTAVGFDIARARAAVARLLRLHYLALDRGSYYVTGDGRAYQDAARRKPYIGRDVSRWMDEALTGINEDGNPTKIENAAIPGKESHYMRPADPESLVGSRQVAMRARRKMANDLGVGMREFERRWLEGSIKMCPGIDGEEPHPGIFHKKGDGWQDRCRVCRKMKRDRKKGG